MTAFSQPAATWNSRFEAAEGYLFGTEPNLYLRSQVQRLRRGGRVLCVADGDGRNSVWLARQGFVVDAFDIAEVGVHKAQALAREAGVVVNHEVADADTWAWPQARYDAVVAIFIQFADPAQRALLFDRMAQALRPGGLLVLQGYTPRQLDYKTGGPPLLSHLYTEALLREAFASLQIEELRVYEDELAEGTQHRGRSALVGLVARRPA
ncbi:Tellurite resistance protein TehB [Burkholderiales bacterium JOSHI_001]|nr:Tellurite resistance protein TehB [Burkholderiales bacterium JOSHI_001]